jgi:hypothetical protein
MENKKSELEMNTHLAMVLYMQALAMQNAASPEAKSVLTREEKHWYNTMNSANQKFCTLFKKRFDEELNEFMDENSFMFLDLVSMIRDPEHKDKALELFTAIKLFLDGEARLLDDTEHKEIKMSKDFLTIKTKTNETEN